MTPVVKKELGTVFLGIATVALQRVVIHVSIEREHLDEESLCQQQQH